MPPLFNSKRGLDAYIKKNLNNVRPAIPFPVYKCACKYANGWKCNAQYYVKSQLEQHIEKHKIVKNAVSKRFKTIRRINLVLGPSCAHCGNMFTSMQQASAHAKNMRHRTFSKSFEAIIKRVRAQMKKSGEN